MLRMIPDPLAVVTRMFPIPPAAPAKKLPEVMPLPVPS